MHGPPAGDLPEDRATVLGRRGPCSGRTWQVQERCFASTAPIHPPAVTTHVQGEAYINRAAQLQTQTKNDELQIVYKVCQGRVLDYKRKFIEAASR